MLLEVKILIYIDICTLQIAGCRPSKDSFLTVYDAVYIVNYVYSFPRTFLSISLGSFNGSRTAVRKASAVQNRTPSE
jgi:hypothetical protein